MNAKIQYPPLWWWASVIIGFTFMGIVAYTTLIPMPNLLRTIAFYAFPISLFFHILEALYCYWIALKSPYKSVAIYWFLQTLVCGFMSIILLQKMIKKSN